MRYIIVFFLFFTHNSSYAQNNLIHNASFEDNDEDEKAADAPCKNGQVELMQVWESDAYFPSVFCAYNSCKGEAKCGCEACGSPLIGYVGSTGFHTSDWFKCSDAGNSNNPYCCVTENNFTWNPNNPNYTSGPPGSRYYITGRTGAGYIGMSENELVQQKFFNSNKISGGKTYVVSLYVRIPRPVISVHGTIYEPGRVFDKSWIHEACNSPDFQLQDSLSLDEIFHLDLYLSKNKIKYKDGPLLTCQHNQIDNFKEGNNDIYKITSFPISIATYPIYQWHKLTYEFVCPSSPDFDWFTIEVDDDGNSRDPYILIDDVSINEKCDFECTKTSGIPNPIIGSYVNGSCSQGQVSNIQNVRNLKIEVFTVLGQQPVRTQTFSSTNGFAGPRYWDGLTDALSPAAPATYLLKATCENDCGEYSFSDQIVWTCANSVNPIDVTSEVEYKECCEVNHYFNNKTFGSGVGLPYPYLYHPQNGIYMNSCTCTPNSYVTLKGGTEVVLLGETKINTHSMVEFHALIEECPNAHRDTKDNSIETQTLSDANIRSENSYQESKLNKKEVGINKKEFISVTPNPSTGVFRIDTEQLEELPYQIVILDIMGRILKKTDKITTKKFDLDLSNENQGVFIMNIYYNNRTISKKLIKN